jgi:hypothetical protein
MEETKNTSEKIVDAAGNWIDAYRELLMLRVVEHGSLGASVSIIGVISFLFIIFVLLFLGLGAAWWLGESLENMKAGFFIVGGVYIILLGVVLGMAKKVFIPGIRNLIIKKIYEQD